MNKKMVVALFITMMMLIALPAAFRAEGEGERTANKLSDKSKFSYPDNRMGEQKDLSDKFMFARIHFGPIFPGGYWGDRGEQWSHDFPEAGLHLRKILSEVSKTPVYVEENEYVFTFNDPNLHKYPLAYICEVGHLDMSEDEIKGMREYLLRGGFLIVDDFRGDWEYQNFFEYVKRAFPEEEYKIKPLDVSHPIFNCFFSIKTLELNPMYRQRGYNFNPQFLGMEDKHGRLMMIINFNYDVSDYWQWSNDPFAPIEESNTAYKFGVNYIFYAMTH
ncbi:MAG: DUF4159 domain-containing protein [Acidobacteriota bacterium]